MISVNTIKPKPWIPGSLPNGRQSEQKRLLGRRPVQRGLSRFRMLVYKSHNYCSSYPLVVPERAVARCGYPGSKTRELSELGYVVWIGHFYHTPIKDPEQDHFTIPQPQTLHGCLSIYLSTHLPIYIYQSIDYRSAHPIPMCTRTALL